MAESRLLSHTSAHRTSTCSFILDDLQPQTHTSPKHASQPNRTSARKTFASSQVAGTLDYDLTDGQKRIRRTTRTTGTLSTFWRPFGLFSFLFLFLLFGALIVDATSTSNQNDNRIHHPRWRRSIQSNLSAQEKSSERNDSIEFIQRPTTTAPLLRILNDTKVQQTQQSTTNSPTTVTTPSILQKSAEKEDSKQAQSLNLPLILSAGASSTSSPSFTVSDVLLNPDSIIVFSRSAYYNGKPYKNLEKRTEHFKIDATMDGQFKIECKSGVRNRRYLRNNITFETYWVNAHSFEIVSNSSDLIFDNAWKQLESTNQMKVRCAARLSIQSRSIKSVIHSKYIILQAVNPPVVQLTPHHLDVAHMQSARLKCEYNATGDKVRNIYWTYADSQIKDNEFQKVYTSQTISLLYLFNINIRTHGESVYACHVLLTNGQLLNSTNAVKLSIYDEQKGLVDIQDQLLPNESIEVRANEDFIIDCWNPNVDHIRWYRLHPSLTEIISTEPVLLFKNATTLSSGKYECKLENNFGVIQSYKFEVFVDDNFFQIEPIMYSIVRKNQGTPAKMLCKTFPEYEELPHMAHWFKDGNALNSPLDIVYRKTAIITDAGREGKAIYVAMAQVEDQGFYECIIRKEHTERSQQVLLLVEQTTNETLTNLNITVDHSRGCFSSEFVVPSSVDFRIAQSSHYFLVYYLSDMTEPLNVIPGTNGAKCNSDNKCTVSCWTPSYPFEPATTYTFRISAVFIDSITVITPFSSAVNATSWEGPATHAVQLNWLYDAKADELSLSWKRPKSIGSLERYQLEILEPRNERRKLGKKIPENLVNATLSQVGHNFALQMRLIPVTKSGMPNSQKLRSDREFGYTLMLIDENSPEMDASLPPPVIQVHQINSEPKFELTFDKLASNSPNATLLRIQYRQLMSLHARSAQNSRELDYENIFEELSSDGKEVIVLSKRLEAGNLYQVCAAFERQTVPPVIGYWHCENVPLLDKNGQLALQNEETSQAEPKHVLPLPVDCEKSDCHCVHSPEDRNLVLIRWRSHNGPSNYKSSPVSSYTVHYTLNETDATERMQPRSRFYREGNDTVIELRGLFPSLTYNIMIEPQNQQGNGIEGTYFTCVAPKGLEYPPPEPSDYNVMGTSGATQIYWKPPIPASLISSVPDFDGYTIQWSTDNISQQTYFTAGHKQNSELLSGLQHGHEYTVYLKSHSATKGDSSFMSQPLHIRIPELKPDPPKREMSDYDKVQAYLDADAKKPWYNTLRFRLYLVLAAIALVIIVCCAGLAGFISIKYYDWFSSPQALERKRLKKLKKAPSMGGISSGRASNASSRLSLNSIGSGSRVPAISEQEQLIPNVYGLPLHRESRHKKNQLDMKGGPHGYRPKGHHIKVLDDPEFKQKVAEVNKDPTGFGKSIFEVLEELKQTQEEELALIRQREEQRYGDEIEMQTFSIQHQPYTSHSGTSVPSVSSTSSRHSRKHRHSSGSNRRKSRLHRQVAESSPLNPNRQISSIDDAEEHGEIATKKESVQAEIHQEPNRRSMFASKSNRLPSKTHSLTDLSSSKQKCNASDFQLESRLEDPLFIKNHKQPQRRHFFKRPSIISLQNNKCYPSESASVLQTPQSPHLPCQEDQAIMHGSQPANHIAPLEFHLGVNGIERRRLKTTTTAPNHQQRKKYSVGGNAATASLPNLNDSGIVYDESGHHHTYFHHQNQACPSGLHPIVSMKLLRLTKDDDESVSKNEEETTSAQQNHPDVFHLLQHSHLNELQPTRRQSLADGESAVSTSSGASSHESGASNRYELDEVEDESNQLISPQTPVRTFGSTPGTIILPPSVYLSTTPTAKDYCSVQMCNYNSSAHEDKRPLEILNNETLSDGLQTAWYPRNV